MKLHIRKVRVPVEAPMQWTYRRSLFLSAVDSYLSTRKCCTRGLGACSAAPVDFFFSNMFFGKSC